MRNYKLLFLVTLISVIKDLTLRKQNRRRRVSPGPWREEGVSQKKDLWLKRVAKRLVGGGVLSGGWAGGALKAVGRSWVQHNESS